MTCRKSGLAVALIALPLLASDAGAQIAVSANDNKVVNQNGANVFIQNPPSDTVTIVDLGVSPPKVGGIRPYSLEISSKGDVAVVGNQGGGQGDSDTINVIDLKANPPRIVDTISVGQTPEGVAMSRDGAYVAVTVMNGSQRAKSHPAFNDYGLVKIYRIDGTKLTHVADGKVGHWCQGAVWSKDNKSLLVQCMVEKELQALGFDGKELKMIGAIKVDGGPAGIRTADR